jgi:hypothetical protein
VTPLHRARSTPTSSKSSPSTRNRRTTSCAPTASASRRAREIDRLIDGWRTDPKSLQRVVAIESPSSRRRRRAVLLGAIADAIYGLRLLRAKPVSPRSPFSRSRSASAR